MKVSELTIKEIKEIKEKVNQLEEVPPELIDDLAVDDRKGVQQIARSLLRKKKERQEIEEKYNQMKRYEQELWKEGYQSVAGLDEAGRGPLAGPVVAAAVILSPEKKILGLDDSKQLSAKKREELYKVIYEQAEAVGVGSVDNNRIDEINILQATYEAMKKAIADLEWEPEYLLIDAEELPAVDIPQQGLEKGDSRSISIAAASIIAKVTRDRKLEDYHEQYPQYNFLSNKGYGTAEHINALKKHGPTPIHRTSYEVVQKTT